MRLLCIILILIIYRYLPACDEGIEFTYSSAYGIGPEQDVMRRDPSDIIKVKDSYYIWYTKGQQVSGYDATIWYATSADGHHWIERGEALARGPVASWDEQSVFTPNILVAENKYWLFYTAVPKPFYNSGPNITKTAIGLAVSDSPDGPWQKLNKNPILKASDNPKEFDSMRVDDACLLVRDGKYWLYYKGRQWDNTPGNTKMGVAIASEPGGPYIKQKENPLIGGGHEVLAWPFGSSVMAMVSNTGPKEIAKSLQVAEDGINFGKYKDLMTVPSAPGAFRPDAFSGNSDGAMIEWGIHIGQKEGYLPFLERFELRWINEIVYPKKIGHADSVLTNQIREILGEFHGEAGVYVRHLTTGQTVAINADTLFPTASMIKVPIMLSVFDKIHSGELNYHQEHVYYDSLFYPGEDILGAFKEGEKIKLSKMIMLMITTSDNTASLWCQKLVGTGTAINAWLSENGFEKTRVNSRTPGRKENWEIYGWGQTTPREMAGLLTLIREGKAVSLSASTEMYRILCNIYWNGEALSQIPPWVQAASKQGAVSASRSEVVLVNAPSGDYVFCLITKNQKDTSWKYGNEGYVLLRSVSALLWKYFEPDYQWQPDPELEKWEK